MNFSLAACVLGVTAVLVLLVLLHRARDCKFWRMPENNRRKSATSFEGPERRRCARCPYQDKCDKSGTCLFEQT